MFYFILFFKKLYNYFCVFFNVINSGGVTPQVIIGFISIVTILGVLIYIIYFYVNIGGPVNLPNLSEMDFSSFPSKEIKAPVPEIVPEDSNSNLYLKILLGTCVVALVVFTC